MAADCSTDPPRRTGPALAEEDRVPGQVHEVVACPAPCRHVRQTPPAGWLVDPQRGLAGHDALQRAVRRPDPGRAHSSRHRQCRRLFGRDPPRAPAGPAYRHLPAAHHGAAGTAASWRSPYARLSRAGGGAWIRRGRPARRAAPQAAAPAAEILGQLGGLDVRGDPHPHDDPLAVRGRPRSAPPRPYSRRATRRSAT